MTEKLTTKEAIERAAEDNRYKGLIIEEPRNAAAIELANRVFEDMQEKVDRLEKENLRKYVKLQDDCLGWIGKVKTTRADTLYEVLEWCADANDKYFEGKNETYLSVQKHIKSLLNKKS
jgi:hypothetical protein